MALRHCPTCEVEWESIAGWQCWCCSGYGVAGKAPIAFDVPRFFREPRADGHVPLIEQWRARGAA